VGQYLSCKGSSLFIIRHGTLQLQSFPLLPNRCSGFPKGVLGYSIVAVGNFFYNTLQQ
jgi:hypothetical protein